MFDIKNYGINIGQIGEISFNKTSTSTPKAEIVEFECFGFKDVLEINDIAGCLKSMNTNMGYGGLVFLFKAKKDMELLNRKVYLSGIKAYVFNDDGNIPIIHKFFKNDISEIADDSATQRVEDDDALMQFGFVEFFDRPRDLDTIYEMNIEAYFAIGNVKRSYIANKRGIEIVDDKLVCKNIEITYENKNVYIYAP